MLLLLCLAGLLYANADPIVTSSGKAHVITLNDGHKMPAFGLGTFLGFDENGQKPVENGIVENAVTWAIQSGYRLVDTAALYQNEDQIGKSVAQNVKREEIFIVDKLAMNAQRDVIKALRGSLEKLKMDYVDLYLIHFPIAFTPDHKTFDVIDYLDTWKQMEQAQKLGLAKSIGLSNFNISQIERVLANCEIQPVALEVEVNLNLAQDKLINYCKSKNIAVIGYSPFGSLFQSRNSATAANEDSTNNTAADERVPPPPTYDDETLVILAKKYGKNTPQIVLRYLVQRGVIPIPKSTNKKRIEQNIDIFDFVLTQEDMDTLAKFNKDYRVVWPTYWQDHPYYPFEKTDKHEKNPFVGNKAE